MLKWIKRLLLLALVLSILALLSGWWLLHSSLPTLDGKHALAGLGAPVSIQRDGLGVVTIDAASEDDALRALGYVHAQERYFEMDLMRRSSSGELAELFGQRALPLDRQRRMHRMRARIDAHLDDFTGERKPQLQAYVAGVNAGLDGLRLRPWPYLLLRQAPRKWEIADSALTGYAMYFDLQDSQNQRELALLRLRPHLPDALYRLLIHAGSTWDAPMLGDAVGDAMLPAPADVDLRKLPGDASTRIEPVSTRGIPGSNNWAVAGTLTGDGRAILADDMHLGLRAPNIWFRVRLRYPDPKAPGSKVDVSGFSLPGLPAIVVGSNTRVAWGFTNSYVDTLDWVHVHPCTARQQAGSCEAVSHHQEVIQVAGAEPESLDVEETRYGPLMHPLPDGDALALRWVAHQPGALDVNLAELVRADDIPQVLAIADRIAIPAQNLLVADRHGDVAWRVLGPLPARQQACQHDALFQPVVVPAAPGDGTTVPVACPPWAISTVLAPVLRSPEHERLWTANARVLPADAEGAMSVFNDGGYTLGARSHQIRDDLQRQDRFDEHQLLAIQLEDRAVFLQRWWSLLQEEAKRTDANRRPALHRLADAADHWEGRASVDSVSYRLVREWRVAVHSRILDGLVAPARIALGADFLLPDVPQLEGVAWPLLQARPMHLLSPRYPDWDALLEDAASEVVDTLEKDGPLQQRHWGERNTARICHPLASALPARLQSALCMPADALAGDSAMPRVQGPSFGASERMVVSPGHEAEGIIHMPGGQSGNPLSPYWGAGHEDWVHGRPTPFLPGPTEYTLTLPPRAN